MHFTLSGFICLSRLHSPSPHLTYLTMFCWRCSSQIRYEAQPPATSCRNVHICTQEYGMGNLHVPTAPWS